MSVSTNTSEVKHQPVISISIQELDLLSKNTRSEYLEPNEVSIPNEAQATVHQLLSLIGRAVEFKLRDNSTKTGFVYNLDPEQQGFIVVPCGRQGELELPSSKAVYIMLRGIRSLQSLQSCTRTIDTQLDITQLFQTQSSNSEQNGTYPKEDSLSTKTEPEARSKESVLKLLTANRLPFEEKKSGVIVVMNSLTLTPPYTARSCRCGNEIILQRVREILTTLEPDTALAGT